MKAKPIPYKKYQIQGDYHWESNSAFPEDEADYFDTLKEAVHVAKERVLNDESERLIVVEAKHVVKRKKADIKEDDVIEEEVQ